MGGHATPQVAGPQIHKGLEETEQRRVGEHDEGSDQAGNQDRRRQGCGQVRRVATLPRDDELVEVVQMRQAEDEWGDEGYVNGRRLLDR